ncbi:MAG: dipeptidase [Armatimonadetes bacterium]|nr:dipeptidase [Armatimonadota bacterium]
MSRTKKYSPAEPVTDVRHVPIRDNGEPLVDYLALSPRLRVGRARWAYRRVSYLRRTVAERLASAAESLPDGACLAVIEGWRPPYIQRRMYAGAWNRWKERHPDWSDVQLRRVVNRFTAPIHGKVPPPHSTGGALDVVLADADGYEFAHTSPFELFDPRAFPTDAPGLDEAAREVRRVLSSALSGAGLTNYPSEWWHWSYGDQGWAYRTGAEAAVYGPTEPEGWSGFPEDMSDGPLERA